MTVNREINPQPKPWKSRSHRRSSTINSPRLSTTSPNPAPAESIPKPPIDPELPAPLSMGDVMRIPMLRRLWYAQVVSVFGDFLALFAAISILTFKLHATAQQVTV